MTIAGGRGALADWLKGHVLHARAKEDGRWAYTFCPCASLHDDTEPLCTLADVRQTKELMHEVVCSYRAFLDTPFVTYTFSLEPAEEDGGDEAANLDSERAPANAVR